MENFAGFLGLGGSDQISGDVMILFLDQKNGTENIPNLLARFGSLKISFWLMSIIRLINACILTTEVSYLPQATDLTRLIGCPRRLLSGVKWHPHSYVGNPYDTIT